jgi:hypothetical protein
MNNEAWRERLKSKSLRRWPPGFFDFEAIPDVPDFKSFRRYLKDPHVDPFECGSEIITE